MKRPKIGFFYWSGSKNRSIYPPCFARQSSKQQLTLWCAQKLTVVSQKWGVNLIVIASIVVTYIKNLTHLDTVNIQLVDIQIFYFPWKIFSFNWITWTQKISFWSVKCHKSVICWFLLARVIVKWRYHHSNF